MNREMEKVKYPIGEFSHTGPITSAMISAWIDEIAALPDEMRAAIRDLTPEQLDTPYRPGGWTLRQVVHHVADSHLNSYVRFKWALTEDRPAIKTYFEERWAELPDYREPLELSLDFLELLHKRWVVLLRSLDEAALSREFVHPDSGLVSLAKNVGIYAWHGRHHVAHITTLRERMGW